ncbi:hypothetical protein [Sphingobium sp.]|uniref:hypothetical protein n=1 Tax=Sphingobium sp. TaxID=1912891 RepID=UPI0028BE5174|nr:hypothetical protein [Sphingobium sp.]
MLFASLGALCASWPVQARAQVEEGSQVPAAEDSVRVGDIVVTARKRNELLIDVPEMDLGLRVENLPKAKYYDELNYAIFAAPDASGNCVGCSLGAPRRALASFNFNFNF